MEHSHHRVSPSQYEHDTINALYAGANFGWPEVADPGSGFDQPAWGSGPGRTLAISGGAFVSGPAWGDWSGHLFVGAMSGAALLHFSVSANTVTELEPYLVGAYGRLRSPVFGSDGFLYVTTDEGSDVIVRITPSLLRRP
jgi:glucose/arabinose dehydrogenase